MTTQLKEVCSSYNEYFTKEELGCAEPTIDQLWAHYVFKGGSPRFEAKWAEMISAENKLLTSQALGGIEPTEEQCVKYYYESGAAARFEERWKGWRE